MDHTPIFVQEKYVQTAWLVKAVSALYDDFVRNGRPEAYVFTFVIHVCACSGCCFTQLLKP